MTKIQLSRGRLAAFVSPHIPLAALGLPLVVNLPPFYASEMGLGLVAVSQVFFFARLWDVFLDLGFGFVSDQMQWKWGRRKPWILIGLPILLFTIYRLFLPSGQVSELELFATLFIFYIGWTFVILSHYAWSSEISDDYDGRSKVQGWIQLATVGGMTLVLTLTAYVESIGGTRFDQMRTMGLFGLVLLPVTCIAAVSLMGEPAPDHRPSLSIKLALTALRRNKPLRFVIAADLLVNLTAGLIGSTFIFFARYYLELGTQASALLFVYFLAGVFGIPVWTRIALRFGKRQCFVLHSIFNLVTLPLLFLIPHNNFGIAAVIFAIVGTNYGTASIVLRAMMSDVIDVDRLDTGQDRSGLYFALLTLTAKLGLAAPLIVFYPILSYIGFQAQGRNSPEAIAGLAYIYILSPCLFAILGIWLMRRFPIDAAAQAQMRAEITKRTAARLRRL